MFETTPNPFPDLVTIAELPLFVILEVIVAVAPDAGFIVYAVPEITPEPETVPLYTVNVKKVGLVPLISNVPPVTVTS